MEKKEMEMFKSGNVLHVYATNSPEFAQLLGRAKKEAQQLNDTLSELSCFTFEFEFGVRKDQAGDMEEASSAINAMPTK